VIRKRLKSKEITRKLHNEKMFLRLLNQLRNPNIIRLLGSYTYQEEHYFLFPCIDMDLKHFLREQGRFGKFRSDLTFYSALRGLSDALANTHRLRLNQEAHGVDFEAIGYHHDIRPPNILVSRDTFLLADFGLGNLKSTDSHSDTPFKHGAGDYLAPECSDDEGQKFTRAVDVWAFGCLIAETATYMTRGASGVREFSDKRLTPSARARWVDSMFYGRDANVKPEVTAWLEELVDDTWQGTLISALVKLCLEVLTGDPQRRCKIEHVRDQLTFLSLRAHCIEAQVQFSRHMHPSPSSASRDQETANNIWFLQERFCAWGRALMLDATESTPELLPTLHPLHDKFTRVMTAIVDRLGGERKRLIKRESAPTNDDIDEQYTFENEIDQLVESLWDDLTPELRKRAQDHWHQAILCNESKGFLDSVQQTLKSRYKVYDIADAMAKMRKIRLEVLQADSLEGAADTRSIALGDIEFSDNKSSRHALGCYKKDVPVLVERMRYSPGTKNIHPQQRKLVISLKAKSFSVSPKPESLHILECIGIFEEDRDETEYGLVYRSPEGSTGNPTTLLERLSEGQKRESRGHPLLGDKFRLAYALADFMKEFHTIGWLHESFNPNNVLFFDSDDGLWRPYVVGLHKSRPDGSFWQTEGPSVDEDLQDYQHPEYANTGRYRQAFDYYSLGVVLLEIGLWRPLKSWQAKFRYLGMAEIRAELIKIGNARLGTKMGAVYRDVVIQCMDGSLAHVVGRKDDEFEDKAIVLGWFTQRVVEPLQRLAKAAI
jgi:serine/threonine protein kinase